MRICNQINDSINKKTIATNLEAVQDAAVSEQEKSNLRTEKQHTAHWLLWISVIGLLTIACISYCLYYNRRQYHHHLLEQENDFNRRIDEMRARMEEMKILDAEGKVQSKMLRQTMNIIESQLNVYPRIIRCHRAFIVNLQHVRHAATSSAGLTLTLDATSLRVPVSKTYLPVVKASLE